MILKQDLIDLIILGKKTQTRRPKRGYYVVGRSYSLQPCRTCKGIQGYRIVIDRVKYEAMAIYPSITTRDAIAEGGYTPEEFESLFNAMYPKWNRVTRFVFVFHLLKVGL